MDVDIRDSASLKPAELDELSQVLRKAGSPLPETTIDDQVERFSRVTMVVDEDEIHGFLFGSLERIGGTPCVLWGLGATNANGEGGPLLEAMTTELYRRAAISFPDEDVLVAGRIAHPALYQLFGDLQEPVPRPGYRASGEDRAWGRRLAKRFGCDDRYDDRAFRSAGDGKPAPKLDIVLGVEPGLDVLHQGDELPDGRCPGHDRTVRRAASPDKRRGKSRGSFR